MRHFLHAIADRVFELAREQAIAAADAWINDRYLFIVRPEQKPTLEWFLGVKVEVSTEPGLIAREVSRQLAATGALSPATGASMPQASPAGRSGGF